MKYAVEAIFAGLIMILAVGVLALPTESVSVLQDLGNLGGDFTLAAEVNDLGQVVGSSTTASGVYHAFVWDPATGMSDLEDSSPYTSQALDINNIGQIVGVSYFFTGGVYVDHATLWEPLLNTKTDLTPPGKTASVAKGINDAGLIVGTVGTGIPMVGEGCVWTPDGAGGYDTQFLPPPDGDSTCVLYDVNNNGLISGYGLRLNLDTGFTDHRACVWTPDPYGGYYPAKYLEPLPGGTTGMALEVNDVGQVVGNVDVDYWGWKLETPCVWNYNSVDGEYHPTDMSAYSEGRVGRAIGVNDFGAIVGAVVVSASAEYACRWTPNSLGGYDFLILGPLGGSISSAGDINNLGYIVAQSDQDPSPLIYHPHAFIWKNVYVPDATPTELSDQIDKLLAENKIDANVAKALKAKVNVAIEMIKKLQVTSMSAGDIVIEGGRKSGGTQPIVSVLTAFNTQVSAFVCSGKIGAEDGALLTSMANEIIASLALPSVIADVTAYYYNSGCGPTAGGMVIGYWDYYIEKTLTPGLDCNLVVGSAAVGRTPNDPLMNSQQVNDMIGDLSSSMGTESGRTDYDHIETGLEDYAGILGQGWTSEGQTYRGPGLTWDVVKQEIDSQRPMVFFVDSDVDGTPDHFVTVIGYCELDNANLYAFYSTYDFGVWWASFDSSKKGNFFGVNAGVSFDISPISP